MLTKHQQVATFVGILLMIAVFMFVGFRGCRIPRPTYAFAPRVETETDSVPHEVRLLWDITSDRDPAGPMGLVLEPLIERVPAQDGANIDYQAKLARRVTIDNGRLRVALDRDKQLSDGSPITAALVRRALLAAKHRPWTAIEVVSEDELAIDFSGDARYVKSALAQIGIGVMRKGQWVGSGDYIVESMTPDFVLAHREDGTKVRVFSATNPLARRAHAGKTLTPPSHVIASEGFRSGPATSNVMIVAQPNCRREHLRTTAFARAFAAVISDAYPTEPRAPIWWHGPIHGAPRSTVSQGSGAIAELWSAAGWVDEDGDGVRARKEVRQLEIAYADESEDAKKLAKALRSSGIPTRVVQLERPLLRKRLQAGQFDIAMMTLSLHTDDDLRPFVGRANNLGKCGSESLDLALNALARADAGQWFERAVGLIHDRWRTFPPLHLVRQSRGLWFISARAMPTPPRPSARDLVDGVRLSLAKSPELR